MKRVRTLLRVSSKQQLHGDDIPVQREEAKRFIAERPDWEFDHEYIEKAVSAYKNSVSDRKVLMDIYNDAKDGQFDILLTYMSDRIGRKEEYALYISDLNELGIEVWSIKEGRLSTDEDTDRLLNFIRFWTASKESNKTAMRVRDAQKELVLSGRYVGGKAPYGYRLIPSGEISNHGRLLKKLEIVPEQAEVIKLVFHLATKQGMGFEKIAKTLNAKGIPAINTDKWKFGTIASILRNPIYMGYVSYGRRKGHGNFRRLDREDWIYAREQNPEITIVSQSEWELAQEIREDRKAKIDASKRKNLEIIEKQPSVPFSTSGQLLFTGLVYCGYCGKRLRNGSYNNRWTLKTGEERVSFTGRYTCPTQCAERSNYSQHNIEDIVLEIVEKYIDTLQSLDIDSALKEMQETQESTIQKEISSIKRKQNKLIQDIDTLVENIPAALRGDFYFSAERLSELIKSKETELQNITEELASKEHELETSRLESEDLQKIIGIVPNWRKEFTEADIRIKRMMLYTIIERIEVKDKEMEIKFKLDIDRFRTLVTSGSPTTPCKPG